jgi:hypothetical protein
MFGSAQGGCRLQAAFPPALMFQEYPSVDPAGFTVTFGRACLICHLSALLPEKTMDVTEKLNSLMRKSFDEIKTLPESESNETIKHEGHRFQVTTWCEQLEPARYQVMVSIHRLHILGASSLVTAKGFTIDASGKIELLNQQRIDELFQ